MKTFYLPRGSAVELLDPTSGRAVAVSHTGIGIIAATILSSDTKHTAHAACDQYDRVYSEDTGNQRAAWLEDAGVGERLKTLAREHGWISFDETGDPIEYLKELVGL